MMDKGEYQWCYNSVPRCMSHLFRKDDMMHDLRKDEVQHQNQQTIAQVLLLGKYSEPSDDLDFSSDFINDLEVSGYSLHLSCESDMMQESIPKDKIEEEHVLS